MTFNLQDKIKNESGVYIIKNIIDGRIYIGSTNNFYKRYVDHKSMLLKNKHANPILQNFVNKYGIHILSFNVLCFCSNKLLRYNEKILIDQFNPEFNIKPLDIKDFDLYDEENEKEKVLNMVDNMLSGFNLTTD